MKIRDGFVSNSSSQSFCIYGTCFDDFDKLKEKFGDDYFGKLEELLGSEFIISSADSDYNLYIGRNWASIKDTETGKQFKETVEKKLKEVLGDDIEMGSHEASWYNG